MKSDYYEQEHDESENIDRDVGKSLARVAARTSSNHSPSPISDVYFIGNLHLMFGFLVNIPYMMHIYDDFCCYKPVYQTPLHQSGLTDGGWWLVVWRIVVGALASIIEVKIYFRPG